MICDRCGKEIGDELEFQTILNDTLMSLYKKLETVKEPERYVE